MTPQQQLEVVVESARQATHEAIVAEAMTITGGVSAPSRETLDAAHALVNKRVEHRPDDAAIGDEWLSATATLARGYDDCEGFACLKLAIWLALFGGKLPASSSVAVLVGRIPHPSRRRRTIDHAVLRVVLPDGNRYICCNTLPWPAEQAAYTRERGWAPHYALIPLPRPEIRPMFVIGDQQVEMRLG